MLYRNNFKYIKSSKNEKEKIVNLLKENSKNVKEKNIIDTTNLILEKLISYTEGSNGKNHLF